MMEATDRQAILARWLSLRGSGTTEEREAKEAVLGTVIRLARHRARKHQYLWHGILDQDDAEQIAIIAAWESLDSFRPEKSALSFWICMYVRSRLQKAVNWYPRRKRPGSKHVALTFFPSDLMDRIYTCKQSEVDLDPDLRSTHIRGWAERLPPQKRDAVLLALEGLSAPEIGERMGVSANCVREHLRVARQRLKIIARGARKG